MPCDIEKEKAKHTPNNNRDLCMRFLRYAGGKQRLVRHIMPYLPARDTINGKFIEPFLGSGAVFFALNPDSALLSDIDEHLIDLYRLAIFMKIAGSRIACGSYDSGSSFEKSAYYGFANPSSSTRDKHTFSTKFIFYKWKFGCYGNFLLMNVLNFASCQSYFTAISVMVKLQS